VIELSDHSILSVSRDFTAKIWEEKDGTFVEQITLIGHTNYINCACEIPPSDVFPLGAIATGSSDQTIKIWDKSNFQTAAFTFQGHTDTISSLSITPDGQHLLSTSWDQ
jgi:WD40 repeat protein